MLETGVLTCPYLAWSFGAGRAVDIPQLKPGLPIPPAGHFANGSFCERYGLVGVALEDPVATGIEHVLFISACPIDDHRSRHVQLLARDDTEADVPAEQFLALDRQVVSEARVIWERLRAEFPLHPRSMVGLLADRITPQYRRFLSQLLRGPTIPATEVHSSSWIEGRPGPVVA